MSAPPAPIKNAATIILLRYLDGKPHVLMGQRGKNASFMPDKFVFPGGAVDPTDVTTPLLRPINETCLARLALTPREEDTGASELGHALCVAAIRELWEETGLPLVADEQAPSDWHGLTLEGRPPTADGLRYVFRAITPPGRPRRFDARFFLADASSIPADPDDFSNADDELRHIHWVALDKARQLNLPFITEVVLAEVSALATLRGSPPSVPFFNNQDTQSEFLRLV
ncbi:MAG: NUDIX hydrolase [Pseudomonadota bacterium]